MELSQFDICASASEPAFLQLVNPFTNEELHDEEGPVGLWLLGADSVEYQNVRKRHQNRRLARSTKKGRVEPVTVEEIQAETIEALSFVTVGIENLTLDGKPLEPTPHNARRIYERFDWVREQAVEFVEDRRARLGNSSTTSSAGPETTS